ncbi:hypothetical protein LEN26_014054 [Aphanomyces euteiches]|nr:hypothetical protein LEN26_014054 [Aphanomyces euteiches]KAH9125110.1 hypothetical protein AeMF1_004234 [Aphanomyces euteiches]KAH9186346.1 hypothetical protein AeNC1_011675 [Aphanomyces euteiches]
MPGFANLKPLWDKRVQDRYLVIHTTWNSTPVYFHNVYAPVEDDQRAAFFESLPVDFGDDDTGIHIVGGDFNLPMTTSLDATTPPSNYNAGKAECLAWLAALRVTDAWRLMYPSKPAHSGPRRKNRLDYIFVDRALATFHLHTTTYDANRFHGDHLTHTVTLMASPSTSQSQPSSKLWRLPRELLLDHRTVKAIQHEAQSLLDELLDQPDCNAGAKWSGWLRRMKRKMRQGQFNRLRHRQEVLTFLRRRLVKTKSDAKANLADATTVDAVREIYTAAKKESHQASMDSGFDRHANLNESPTAYFLRKPPATKVPITSALLNGEIVTDPADVAKALTAHWSSIMVEPSQAPPPDPTTREAVLDHLQTALSADQRDELDRPLTADELCSAIKSMRKNKSPGLDGWPAAFFQTAPEKFAAILVTVYEYQRKTHGLLLPHQRKSSITLLYKKGERADPGNYRPIALMPVEVKILARVLARRLSSVAHILVHPTQSGFIKGRSMNDHIHLIQALQHRATRTNEEWYATFLDFAKAYDMVRWSFLFEVLERMNIGPEFRDWVQLLYKKPKYTSS